jgi:hypothetical protein
MSKSPSLRRIQADIRELAIDPSDQYAAAPLENDMFEWYVANCCSVDTLAEADSRVVQCTSARTQLVVRQDGR